LAEQWHYYVAYIVQLEPGSIGISAKPVVIDRRIDSFGGVGALIMELTASVFPDGPPDLPDELMPIVPLFWHLITAKQGAGVKPLKPKKGNGGSTLPQSHNQH
jgi:hypothetical protein